MCVDERTGCLGAGYPPDGGGGDSFGWGGTPLKTGEIWPKMRGGGWLFGRLLIYEVFFIYMIALTPRDIQCVHPRTWWKNRQSVKTQKNNIKVNMRR